MKRLSIVHVNTHDMAGGAAKVGWRLAQAQLAAGHEACILACVTTPGSGCSMSFDPQPDRILEQRCMREGLLDYEFQGSHGLCAHPRVEGCDVVHLHNLHGGYFNPFSLIALGQFKPVVWTLHDMQAITGRCAHAFACQNWRSDCGDCQAKHIYPTLKTQNVPLAAQAYSEPLLLAHKALIARLSDACLAVPSQWLKAMVESSILSDLPVTLIPNFCDTRTFFPRDKHQARLRLGLPEQALLIGASARGGPLGNFFKGGDFTRKAVEALGQTFPDLYFVNIGSSGSERQPRVLSIPHLENEADMAWAMSALDLFLYTPVADNAPLVVIEALCCGLPVVSFGTGGIPELINHGVDGFVTPFAELPDLIQAASILLADRVKREEFSRAARVSGTERFDVTLALERYQNLYSQAQVAHARKMKTPARIRLSDLPEVSLTPVFLDTLQRLAKLGKLRLEP